MIQKEGLFWTIFLPLFDRIFVIVVIQIFGTIAFLGLLEVLVSDACDYLLARHFDQILTAERNKSSPKWRSPFCQMSPPSGFFAPEKIPYILRRTEKLKLSTGSCYQLKSCFIWTKTRACQVFFFFHLRRIFFLCDMFWNPSKMKRAPFLSKITIMLCIFFAKIWGPRNFLLTVYFGASGFGCFGLDFRQGFLNSIN